MEKHQCEDGVDLPIEISDAEDGEGDAKAENPGLCAEFWLFREDAVISAFGFFWRPRTDVPSHVHRSSCLQDLPKDLNKRGFSAQRCSVMGLRWPIGPSQA